MSFMRPMCCNSLVQFNTYTSAGAHIAAALVNDPLADEQALAGMLAGYEVHDPVPSRRQIPALRGWAARLREVFEAADEHDQAAAVDALLRASDCRPTLVSHDGQPYHLHYAPVATDLVARVKALTAAGLAHVIAEGGGARIRGCQRAGCGRVFVDVSRNGGRCFCSVRCANQVNVARHRARRRGPGSQGRP
jgi:predicted RNA-binding Zn ribbon-like protein